jgi:hypothetical protein
MYKPSTYLVVTYFPTYLLIYRNYLLTEYVLLTKVKLEINPAHPQLSHNGHHPVDGELGGSWFTLAQNGHLIFPWELQSNLTP